jgi:hypothetical protein
MKIGDSIANSTAVAAPVAAPKARKRRSAAVRRRPTPWIAEVRRVVDRKRERLMRFPDSPILFDSLQMCWAQARSNLLKLEKLNKPHMPKSRFRGSKADFCKLMFGERK